MIGLIKLLRVAINFINFPLNCHIETDKDDKVDNEKKGITDLRKLIRQPVFLILQFLFHYRKPILICSRFLLLINFGLKALGLLDSLEMAVVIPECFYARVVVLLGDLVVVLIQDVAE